MLKSIHHSLRNIIPAILVSWVFSSCTTNSPLSMSIPQSTSQSGQTPIWIADKDSIYPVDKFLAELGEGDNLKDAKSNAAGAIALIFRTKVTVDNTIHTRYTEITGESGDILDMVSQTDIDQTIGQSTEASLSNLKYGESWQDDMGRVYIIAYLDRTDTGNLYRHRITNNDNRVMELVNRSRTQDKYLQRYAFMDATLVMAETNAMLVEQLEIINMPMARSVIHPYNLGDLRAEKADMAVALKLRLEVSGDDEGLVKAILSDWATGKGFSVSTEGDMFLSAVILIKPVQLDNNYENLNWELNLNLIDSTGVSVVSLLEQARSSGISESAALSRVYQDMSGVIRKDFERAFVQYLNSFLEK